MPALSNFAHEVRDDDRHEKLRGGIAFRGLDRALCAALVE